jgi:hypothetical protein
VPESYTTLPPRGVCVNVFFLTPSPLWPGFNMLGRADVHLPLPSTYLSVHNSSYYYITENKVFFKKINKIVMPYGGFAYI